MTPFEEALTELIETGYVPYFDGMRGQDFTCTIQDEMGEKHTYQGKSLHGLIVTALHQINSGEI